MNRNLLLTGLILILGSAGCFQFDDESASKEKPAAKSAEKKPARQKAAAASVKKDKLSWPPKREELEETIPNFSSLEARLRAAASANNISVTDEELYKAIGQRWLGLEKGAPIARLKWEMGRFSVVGETADADPQNAAEKSAKYRYSGGGQWTYSQKRPDNDVSECWEKITLQRGREEHDYCDRSIITWGGSKTLWLKLTWDSEASRWVRKTQQERRQFMDDYQSKLQAQIDEARDQAINDADAADLHSLMTAYQPLILEAFLAKFIDEYRQTPWGEE